ncbi:MAG: 3-deoxy-manno-octulosonate cytidylyltransferase [Bacteroidales bacterium]|nr:3-deoxy-manno-octulosonate cytidylyltransferase [Candidatus Colimorpha onthohippi]
MRTLVVIPARYTSTRFPGKPLAILSGKPVIQWVWEHIAAADNVTRTIVATDDERILNAVKLFGGEAIMTSNTHRSGTDRCGEVVRTLRQNGECYDIVINVQGDEPFVQAQQINALIGCFNNPDTQIATLRTAIHSIEELESPNNVKVVSSKNNQALYFSRQPIPYLRGIDPKLWISKRPYYKHVGLYAFTTSTILKITQLQQGDLEQSESLEQLRWLENGYTIQVCDTQCSNIGIDTPQDLEIAEKALIGNSL